jgi:hypothetical protein
MLYLRGPASSQPNSSASATLKTCAGAAAEGVRMARGLKQVLILPSMVMVWPLRIGKLV